MDVKHKKSNRRHVIFSKTEGVQRTIVWNVGVFSQPSLRNPNKEQTKIGTKLGGETSNIL